MRDPWGHSLGYFCRFEDSPIEIASRFRLTEHFLLRLLLTKLFFFPIIFLFHRENPHIHVRRICRNILASFYVPVAARDRSSGHSLQRRSKTRNHQWKSRRRNGWTYYWRLFARGHVFIARKVLIGFDWFGFPWRNLKLLLNIHGWFCVLFELAFLVVQCEQMRSVCLLLWSQRDSHTCCGASARDKRPVNNIPKPSSKVLLGGF